MLSIVEEHLPTIKYLFLYPSCLLFKVTQAQDINVREWKQALLDIWIGWNAESKQKQNRVGSGQKAARGAAMPQNILSQTPFHAVKLALEMAAALVMERTFK